MPYKQITDTQILGDHIRKIRRDRGYTIDETSAHANCGPRFLSELERGKQTAEIGKTFDVCRVLGIRLIVDMTDVEASLFPKPEKVIHKSHKRSSGKYPKENRYRLGAPRDPEFFE